MKFNDNEILKMRLRKAKFSVVCYSCVNMLMNY